MSSGKIWTVIQPTDFISGTFIDGLGVNQKYVSCIVDRKGEVSVVGLWALREGANKDQTCVLESCYAFWETSRKDSAAVSDPKQKETYRRRRYRLFRDNHLFSHEFLIIYNDRPTDPW